jgi:ribosomal protein L44E
MSALMPKEDPTCSKCGTTYNRGPVIRELKKLDPLAFRFENWTLKFKCQRCGTVIMISGTRDEA